MKQFQLEQVKFPKLSTNALEQPIVSRNKRAKSKAHSEMLRIIIALLIAIFIFNSSQETTINYNEIIKNQKMFLVKNIRGVLPTLSGNIRDLQGIFLSDLGSWQVVHFENYHSNQSEIFNNYTLTFNQRILIVKNPYCKFNVSYEWKNYSYNIDFKEILNNLIEPKKTAQQIGVLSTNTSQQQNKSLNGSVNKKNETNVNKNSTVEPQTSNLSNFSVPVQINAIEDQSNKTPSVQEKQRQNLCNKSQNYFREIYKFASIWTISDKNLYILLQNTYLEEDFYIILQPLKV